MEILSQMKSSLELDPKLFEEGAGLLRAINHELRQQKLHYIHKKGKVTVSELKRELKLEQAVASMHLSILRKEELVIADREGQNIYYSINYQRLKKRAGAPQRDVEGQMLTILLKMIYSNGI